MPPKRGRKRKNLDQVNSPASTNGNGPLAPPERSTWPGWVEMESEPAFFNVMLKEMGVRGVKIQEVYGLEEDMLAILPKPVHALIFLFRYKDTDQAEQERSPTYADQIWFANQIPDFACATVALLNIVNNIKGLQMGKELRDFRDFTETMDPLSRGDAIDSFDFVRNIHNSFAREVDMLNADMHMKQKAAKAKKKQAIAKAHETREANKEAKPPLKEKAVNAVVRMPNRTSARQSRANVEPMKQDQASSRESSPLSEAPESDPEFRAGGGKAAEVKQIDGPRRRSARKPKPRQDKFAASAVVEVENEEGFHFIAYMPIQGHVWKLDGLDSFPQDMGSIDAAEGGDWMDIVRPALQTRMAMYEGAEIEFNLMAIVHDPLLKDQTFLIENMKALQAIDEKSDSFSEGWLANEATKTSKDVILGTSIEFGISQFDIDAVELPESVSNRIGKADDLSALLDLQKEVMLDQRTLRGLIRDAIESEKTDDEKASHRRHDYGTFVRSWLGALAEEELLSNLLETAPA